MKRFAFIFVAFSSMSLYAVTSAQIINNVVFSLYTLDGKKVEKSWSKTKHWRKWGCNSFYKYKVDLSAVIADIDLDLDGDKWIELNALIEDVDMNVYGAYRAPYTICNTIAARDLAEVRWVRAKAFVQFIETPNIADIKFKLKVDKTVFGPFTLKSGMLGRTGERLVTHVANKAFPYIWSSWLGDWISKKLADEVGKAMSGDS